MIVCIYHRDNDGHCSAAIVSKFYNTESVKFISMQYDEPVPFDAIPKNSHIIIVDFSLGKEEDWIKIQEIASEVTWIDHHKTITKWEQLVGHLPGIRDIGERTKKSAALLTWEYYFQDKPVPRVVELVNDYDIWAHKLGSDTWSFHFGIHSFPNDPCETIWEYLLNDDSGVLNNVLNVGGIIKNYNERVYKGRVKSTSFLVDFEGYKCRAINYSGTGSAIFEHIKEKDYDIAIVFFYNGEKWITSLYTTNPDIDVSAIASKYGGGGHKGAAGFNGPNLPPFITS